MARVIFALRIATGLLASSFPLAATAITAIDGAADKPAATAVHDDTAPSGGALADPAIWVLVIAGVAIVATSVRRRRRGSVVIS